MRIQEKAARARAAVLEQGFRPRYLLVSPADYRTLAEAYRPFDFHVSPGTPEAAVHFYGMEVVAVPGQGEPTAVPHPDDLLALEVLKPEPATAKG